MLALIPGIPFPDTLFAEQNRVPDAVPTIDASVAIWVVRSGLDHRHIALNRLTVNLVETRQN